MIAAMSVGGGLGGAAIHHQRVSSSGSALVIDLESSEEEDAEGAEENVELEEEEIKEEEQEGEEEDSESDREWEIITLDDDDDAPRKAPDDMVCYRCPNKSHGKFKDEKKYWYHVKRHIHADHYQCTVCQRPFLKMGYLVSHELRVHNVTPLFENKRDPVIQLAKSYQRDKSEKKNGVENTTGGFATITPTVGDYDEDGTDLEDFRFYDNRYHQSTSIYQYRGPPVDTMLEAYEIQHFKPRPKDLRANPVAKTAIDIHIQNVEKGHDVYKLGRFSTQKGTKKAPANPIKQKVRTTSPARSTSSTSTVGKLTKEDAPNGTDSDDKSKLKRKRVIVFSSNSEDDEIIDSSAQPSQKKKRKQGGASSTSTKPKPKHVFTPILIKNCRLCGAPWETEADIRRHRDEKHSGVHIVELTAVPVQRKKELIKVPNKTEPKPKVTEPKPKVAKQTRKRKNAKVTGKEPPVKKRKGRSQALLRAEPKYPMPDSSFTEKERYMFALGLNNRVRLELFQKKSINLIKLPKCDVVVRKLTPQEIQASKNNVASLTNFLMPHFLLS